MRAAGWSPWRVPPTQHQVPGAEVLITAEICNSCCSLGLAGFQGEEKPLGRDGWGEQRVSGDFLLRDSVCSEASGQWILGTGH